MNGEAQVPPIAFFMPRVGIGGIERTMLNLLGELVKTYPRIDLVVSDLHQQVAGQVPAGVNVVWLTKRRLPWPLSKLVLARTYAALVAFPSLVRYLRSTRPKAVMTFQSGVLAVLATQLSRSRTRIVVREGNPPTVALRDQPAVQRWIKLTLKRLAYPRADALLANSKDVADDMINRLCLPAGRVHVIHNPSYSPAIEGLAAQRPDHPWFNVDREGPVIVSVGRISAQKDFPTLVRSVALVRERLPARLLIVGDGDLRGELEQVIDDLGLREVVDITGFVSNPFQYVARADVFVLSTNYEGLPNVVIEAQACGVPVVATDSPGGQREILLDGEAGRLVPVGDASSMRDAILGYLESPEQAAEHVRKGKEALSRFRSDLVALRYLELMEGK